MTNEELIKLGIVDISNKLNPHKHIISLLDIEINIFSSTTIDDIFIKIFNEGKVKGIEQGELNKINQFRELLNLKQKNELW